MKKLIFVLMVSGLFLTACGELANVTSPSVTTAGCAAQRNGSTVAILDAKVGC